MRDHRFSATTRSIGAATRAAGAVALLARREVIASPETGLRYRIGPLIGVGGFGQVYLGQRVGRSAAVPSTVCVKVSARLESWVREAYFGQLLDGHPRAIRVFDRFPLVRGRGSTIYCLVLEYAEHGDLGSYLHRTGKGFSELSARREIANMLEVLVKLHRSNLLHRDVTPFNVFVCGGRRLKLGDFGITQQQTDQRGVIAKTLNPHVAPREFLIGDARRWQARDDVYQIGQLLAMLLLGSASERVHTRQVRNLPCSDHLKEVIYRCLGDRHKRYETAEQLSEALRTPPVRLRRGQLTSLHGVHIAFTGIFSRPRREAAAAAERAGAIVHGGPSARTSVVVRGRPNPQQAAGPDAGLKLMEIKRLREKGHRIKLIGEAQFWSLVGLPRR